MKNNLLTLATIITLGFFTNSAIAQTSDTETVNAGATLIKPMILQVQNGTSGINFGTINIIGGAASVAVMDPKDGTRSGVTSTGGVDGEAALSVAEYKVSGSNNRAYTLSMPTNAITITSLAATSAGGTAPASATMQVDDFKVSFNGGDATSSGISALSGGEDSFKIGAALTVLGTEDEGVYAGTFSISVDYN
jgi:hypothetical protein